MPSKQDLFGVRPPEPETLMAALKEIFPQFGNDDVVKDVEASDHGLHCAMRRFADYFGSAGTDISDRQARSLGGLLDQAVASDDVLENAVSTCFLEHLRQMDRYEVLALHLSRRVKARTTA